MSGSHDDYLRYWQQAVEDGGGKVQTSDRAHTQAALYRTRREANDDRLEGFALVTLDDAPDMIFIVRKA